MTMTMEKENKTAELEVAAKLTGIEVQTREICDKWILLTYDLPHNNVGDKARREFLLNARKLGACQHTESVYLLPYNGASVNAALELAKAGKLFVWTSESTDPTQAKAVTRNYDAELKEMLKELSSRVDRMIELRADNKLGIRNKMVEKTDEMMANLGEAVHNRGAIDLLIIYGAIQARYRYA
jgi:hypothetical protein